MSASHGRVLVKLCGLRRVEDLRVATEAGADLVGLVFAPSRRQVTVEAARALLDAVPYHPPAVGVFVNASCAAINAVAEQVGLAMVQLSGQEAPEALRDLALPYLKTIHLRPGDSLGALQHIMTGYADAAGFVLDAWSSQGGGAGVTADWSLAAALLRDVDRPVLLAGGLTPNNVQGALAASGATCVDVSSGIERDGQKDPALIHAFVRAARGTAREPTDAHEASAFTPRNRL